MRDHDLTEADQSESEAKTASMAGFQDAALAALSLIRDELKHLLDTATADTVALGTLRRLVVYMSDRAQAVLFLDSAGMPWDAEIVLRSFYETCARILLLCTSEPDERTALEVEYWEVLGAMGQRRRALKVHTQGGLASDDPRAAAILDALRDPSLHAVEPLGSKGRRKAIEQRWSFSEIIASVKQRDIDGVKGLTELAGFLHQYGLASHLIHADGAALDLMWDRQTRSPSELRWLVASHSCRIYTDVVSLECIVAEALRAMLGAEFVDRRELYQRTMACIDLVKPINEAFYATQAAFYQRYGRAEFGDASGESIVSSK